MTAIDLYRHCRPVGVVLTIDEETITADAPENVAIPADEIRWVKSELLAVLKGDYLSAAAELVRRLPDPRQRQALVDLFDQRVGTLAGNNGALSRGEAQRRGYIELVRSAAQAAPGWNLMSRTSVAPKEPFEIDGNQRRNQNGTRQR